MSEISILFWLVVVHYLCDFPLQSEFMANGKSDRSPSAYPRWHIMIAHCAIHAGGVALVMSLMQVPFAVLFGVVEFAWHMWTDEVKNRGWIDAHIDQGSHLIAKAAYVTVAASVVAFQ